MCHSFFSLAATAFRSRDHTGKYNSLVWSGCSEERSNCFKQTSVRVVIEDIMDWILGKLVNPHRKGASEPLEVVSFMVA